MHLLERPNGRCEQVSTRHESTIPEPRSAPAGPATSRKRAVPRWWAEIGLLAGLYLAYELTRGLQSANVPDAERTGWALLDWERRWHLAIEAPLNAGLQQLPVLAVLSGYFYATLHFVVTPAVLVFLYRRRPSCYREARSVLVLATAAALIGYFLLPTAPPRLLIGSEFTDTLATVSDWGWWGGEGSAPRGLGGLTNQLAAMPSLHVGWALWSGWCLARHARTRFVRTLGVAYPVMTTLVVMATANHYLVDALAGSLLVITGWAIVNGYLTLRRRSSRPAQTPTVQAPAVQPTNRTAPVPAPREAVPSPREVVPLGMNVPLGGRQPGGWSNPAVCRSGGR